MSKYGFKYQLQFQDIEEAVTVTIDIIDTSILIDDDAEEQIVTLHAAGEPLIISTTNNDRGKLQVVRSKQAVIRFLSDRSNLLTAATFADAPDDNWLVHIYTAAPVTIFKGFLMLSDVSQPFQPDPNIVELTASDHLALLKEAPLVDADGNNPSGKYLVSAFLSMALKLTGLDLGIKVVNNLRHLDRDDHFYNSVYIDAKTFEDEVGTCVDAYEVLSIILGEDCYITQWQGYWWIMRVDEFDGNPQYVAEFTSNGELSSITGTTIAKSIGNGQPVFFIRRDQVYETTRPVRHARETFEYETPKEVPCNVDFERGTGSEPTGGTVDETIDYTPECWLLLQEGASGTNADIDSTAASDSVGVIRKIFDFGYEKDRYVIVQNGVGSNRHFLKSEGIPVKAKDRLDISIDTRFDTNLSITNVFPMIVRLQGNDGSMWDWKYNEADGTNEWVETFSGSGSFLNQWSYNRSADDTTAWRTISSESKDIPVDGEVYLRLTMGSVAPNQIWYNGLRVEYLAYINGTYRKYSAQYTQITRTDPTGYKTKREEMVRISDSPKPLFKGAMFIIDIGAVLFSGSVQFAATGFSLTGDLRAIYRPNMWIHVASTTNTGFYRITAVAYNIIGNTTAVTTDPAPTLITEAAVISVAIFELTTAWYTAAPFALGSPPGDEYYLPYTTQQVRAIWNQYQGYRVFTGSVKGLGASWTDLLHKITLTDTDLNTNNRYFMLISIVQNWRRDEWNATFAEVYRTDTGKDYASPLTFKYLT